MPTSSSIAPFCMPTGSACCGNSYCAVGENCCEGFCCAAVRLFFSNSFLAFLSFPPMLCPVLSSGISDRPRTPHATSASPAPAAVPSAPAAMLLPPAWITPRQTARTRQSRCRNAVPPTCPSAATSSRRDWAATTALRPRLRRRAYRP